MNKTKILFVVVFVLFLCVIQDGYAENISLKFSYRTNTVNRGDIYFWTESLNTLWQDWQSSKGGDLDGQFESTKFGFSFEFELRIPIFSGLALNLGGSQLKSSTEGTIHLNQPGGEELETHYISNTINALPFKIGFSYSFRLPFFANLSICAGGGRLIIFGKYESTEDYDFISQEQGPERHYWLKRSNTYKSEALGLYATAALEYELFKFLALVIEAEQRWAKMDGFKGPYSYEDYEGNDESGKASLYLYESNKWELGEYYTVLYGHRRRPDTEDVRNVRQGELNFGGYSFKVGIRIIF